MQGRLLARSTTSAPTSVTETSPPLPVTTPTTEESSTILIQDGEDAFLSSTLKPEEEPETTFKLPSEQEQVTEEPLEEDVVTETSVSMSIGQSEAHQIVMTTVKNEDATILDEDEDLEAITTTFRTSIKVPTENPKPAEGILGSSLERPDGLQQELLAAIRRKISKSRENQTKADTPSNDTPLDNEDIEVSPASNSVGSTQQPPFFRYSNPNLCSPFFRTSI